MKHIIRNNPPKHIRQACQQALIEHQNKFGDYGKAKIATLYTMLVGDDKVTVEVTNRSRSYVATPMIKARRLHNLCGQAN